MRFHARVGILPHEREFAQPLEVDVIARRLASATSVLDYRDLYAAVSRVIESNSLEYLESVAGEIHAAVLAMDGVFWARVALRKPHVALAGPLAYAQVAVEGARG